MWDFWRVITLLLIGVPMVSLFCVLPIGALLFHYRHKMAELRLKREALVGQDIVAEFTAVRAEIQRLRDTSMQYDLSFDTTLQQMERRMQGVESAASSLNARLIAAQSSTYSSNQSVGHASTQSFTQSAGGR